MPYGISGNLRHFRRRELPDLTLLFSYYQLSLSKDSRETDFGSITQDEVLGRAEFALWPIRCFGNLTGTVVTDDAVGQGGAE